MQNQNQTLVRNIASLGVVQIVNYVFPLLTIPFVSRIIGPDGFGVINYITAFVAYFVLLINYGFDFTATRVIATNPDNHTLLEKVYCEVSNARIFLFLMAIPIYMGCVFIFPILRENFWISLVLFLNVFSNLLSPQYIFQGLQKLAIFSKLNLIKGVVNTILIFLLIRKPNDLLIYVSIGVFGNIMISLFWVFFVKFNFKLNFKLNALSSTLKVLWKDRLIFFSSIIFSLYTTTNIIILGFFDSKTNIGYYTTAITFITIVQSIINIPLASSLFPFIGRSFSENREAGIDKLRKIVPIVFYLTLCVALGIFVLAPFIVNLIFGSKFEGSVIVIRILSLLPFISGMSGIMGVQTMLNLKLDHDFLRITTIGAFISIILNFILDYKFGYIGTAVSYLFTEVFIMVSFFLTLKASGIHIFDQENFKVNNIFNFVKNIKKIST